MSQAPVSERRGVSVSPLIWWHAPAFPLKGSPAEAFDELWAIPKEWVESLNQRRGGWSGASKHVLSNGERVYVKRQENHFFRDLLRFGRQAPTFRREWRAMKHMMKVGLAVPDMLMYAERKVDGKFQAILVTREMEGYLPVDQLLASNEGLEERRKSIVTATARMIGELHDTGYLHKCMSGKHVLLREREDGEWDACTLDLEKSRRSLSRMGAAMRDFTEFFRNTPGLTPDDRINLVNAYCREWPEQKAAFLKKKLVKRLTARGKGQKAAGLEQSGP